MHPSIYTLGDLHIVRANLCYYKRLPANKFGIYGPNANKNNIVADYQRMYSVIKSRTLRGPLGKLP